MKGYKVTNTDMTCRGFQYEVGKTYKYEGEINICNVGFHFCEQLKDCYNYYSFDHKNVVLEVEGSGEVITEGDKTVCSELKVIRKLELSEVLYDLNLFTKNNRGSYNQGSSNRGSSNRGSYNQGSGNRGSSNRGSGNRGLMNFGSHSCGAFNSKSFIGDKDNAYCFDKPTGLTLTQFYRQHMEVLKGAKRYSFSDIESLPNYSQKKWDKMRRYL